MKRQATTRSGSSSGRRFERRAPRQERMVVPIQVPTFAAGQVQGVWDYLKQAAPQLASRTSMTGSTRQQFMRLVTASYSACAKILGESMTLGEVPAQPAVRRLFNFMGDHLLSSDSSFSGQAHFRQALQLANSGANILVIQNHRSGADTLVFETLLRRVFGNQVVERLAYFAGHVVNLYLLPLMFTAGLHRFQIFSAKYRVSGVAGFGDTEMAANNMKALRAVNKYCSGGGKIVVLYPEGGRGDNAMKRGEPKTLAIARMMARTGRPLYILPTYVHNAANVLPVHRGANEFNEVFALAKRGTAHLFVGKPVSWSDIAARFGGRDEQAQIDTLVGLMARLAPSEDQMGVYAQPQLRALVKGL